MEKFAGKIEVTLQNIGSKSEGYICYLQSEDNLYTLFRDNFAEINDSFFYEYSEKNVIVEGELLNNNWLMIDKIEVVHEEQEKSIVKEEENVVQEQYVEKNVEENVEEKEEEVKEDEEVKE